MNFFARCLGYCVACGLLQFVCTAESVHAQTGNAKPITWHGFLESQVIEQNESRYPLKWGPDNVTWSCKLQGYGQSSPVVWNDRIYVTTVEGTSKERCLVTAINGKSGVIEWVYEEPAEIPAESTPMISRAAPTPVCDSSGVFVFFETGNLVALSHAGKVMWQRKLQADCGEFDNKFGISSSLAQVEDRLFVLLDHDKSSLLVAISKSDGSNAWNVQRSNRGHSWTSPALVRVEERPLIVCSSIGSIDVYDPADGRALATYDSVGGNSVSTPIDCGQGRFLVSSLIRPADGPVKGAAKSNLLARIVKHENNYSIEVEWIAENARGAFCSPIMHRNFCYWINPQGVLFCLDAVTGKEQYSKRLPCGGCWATPLAIGERLYCFGRDGETVVVRIGSNYEELAVGNRVWEDSASTDSAGAPKPASNPQTPLATGRPNARPALYSALAVDEGFIFRRGDHVFRIASPNTSPR